MRKLTDLLGPAHLGKERPSERMFVEAKCPGVGPMFEHFGSVTRLVCNKAVKQGGLYARSERIDRHILAIDGRIIHEEAHRDRGLVAERDEATRDSKVQNSDCFPVDLHLVDAKLLRSAFDEGADFEGGQPAIDLVVGSFAEVGAVVLDETV